jgi:hypothetical protein
MSIKGVVFEFLFCIGTGAGERVQWEEPNDIAKFFYFRSRMSLFMILSIKTYIFIVDLIKPVEIQCFVF